MILICVIIFYGLFFFSQFFLSRSILLSLFWESRYNIQYRIILENFSGSVVSSSLIVGICHRINKLIHNPRRIRLRAQYLSFSCLSFLLPHVFFTLRINLALLLDPSFKSPLSVNVLPERKRTFTCAGCGYFDSSHPFSSTLFSYFDSYRNYGKLTEESPGNM